MNVSWPDWLETITHFSHLLMVFNSSVNFYIYLVKHPTMLKTCELYTYALHVQYALSIYELSCFIHAVCCGESESGPTLRASVAAATLVSTAPQAATAAATSRSNGGLGTRSVKSDTAKLLNGSAI